MLSPLVKLFEGLSAIEATALVLVLSFASAIVMEFVILRIARRYVSNTSTEYDNIVISSLRAPLVITAALV